MIATYGQKTAEGTLGFWHLISVTGKVSNKFSVNFSIQSRYYEQLKNFNQFVVRSGINYEMNPNLTANFSYGFIATDTSFEEQPNEVYRKEHQIGEQLILKNQLGVFDFEHRVWLEQRFIEADYQGILHRGRYRLQLNLPIDQIYFLNFHDEVFLNLQDKFWGQNRLYAAIGAHIITNVSMHAGYFRTYSNHSPRSFKNCHIL
jgi:hypothetical protein